MGAGASIESSGHLYHASSCGCIYRCTYRDQIVEGPVDLVKCCYTCLHRLKDRTFRYDLYKDMCKSVQNQPVHVLTDPTNHTDKNSWMTEPQALVYAHKQGIRSVEEFIYNTNILDKK